MNLSDAVYAMKSGLRLVTPEIIDRGYLYVIFVPGTTGAKVESDSPYGKGLQIMGPDPKGYVVDIAPHFDAMRKNGTMEVGFKFTDEDVLSEIWRIVDHNQLKGLIA